MKSRIAYSACPHDCPSTCALEVELIDERTIGRIHGARANSYTAGVVCAKVARYAERVHHPDRLQTPLRRAGPKGSGQFEAISWDEALNEVAEALLKAERQHGGESIWPYYYAGTMGLVQRDGINRLRHAKRYAGQHKTICSTIARAGWTAGAGTIRGTDPREMAESDLIVIWGTNAVATQVNVMTHVARARKNCGAQVIVVDPYRNATAQTADRHIAVRPGTDGALACAMMQVLFEEGFADRDYLTRYTDDPARLEAHLATRTPKWASTITGLPAREIREFARIYGRAKRSFLRIGYGFTRSRNGAANLHAVSCLPAITGTWQHRGGGALYANSALYHWDTTLIDGTDVADPSIRQLDMTRIGAVLTGDRRDLGDGPPITAMLIQNTNPMTVAPDQNRVHQGFAREDLFVCVHEQFMTETARMADIVLPATTFLEHDDLYQAGGHTHLLVGLQAIEPLAEARSNHRVICDLAQRLGAEHAGFQMTARELIDATLSASGWPAVDQLGEHPWHDCALPFEEAHFLNGFGHADKRFRFAPDWQALGPLGSAMPALPDHWAVTDEQNAEHPFRLVTAPARNFLNTSFTETPGSRSHEGRPEVMLHPDDAADLGIVEAAMVRVGNRQGEIRLHARLFDGLQRGVAIIESIWPNADFIDGRGLNTLTSADPAAPNGGGVFHDTAVWIRPA
ncbi:MAG: molybdopterin oxidoreductase family protein [Proteobacteria bacterium]|nr:MAG: molybdopterin oxidoreductase family protein [Pseudomonadota bacterium]